MKKIIIVALVISMICLAMIGCTPEEQETGPGQTVPLVEPNPPQIASSAEQTVPARPDEPVPETQGTIAETETASGTAPAEADDTTPAAPEITTEDPEEEIPDTYVIDVGGNVGVGGN